MEDREIVSVYYGKEITEEEAGDMAAQIEALYPDAEVELLSGGQAIYQYILAKTAAVIVDPYSITTIFSIFKIWFLSSNYTYLVVENIYIARI